MRRRFGFRKFIRPCLYRLLGKNPKYCETACDVMQGHVIGAIERMDTLHTKLHKLATDLGVPAIKQLGFETKEAFVQKKLYVLRSYP